jgi:DNA topoisomerase-1
MGKNLVIVESPAKARTIEKYLGNDFEVLASYGHVRDLVPKEGAVDPEHGFKMKYQLIEKNEKHVEKIVKAVKKDAVYLATDPDREGEAISWHVYEVPQKSATCSTRRWSTASCSTRSREARDPRGDRATAQALRGARECAAARRALDYLVGFNLSPLL